MELLVGLVLAIAGGAPAAAGTPVISLGDSCSAVVVGEHALLTAAHCVPGLDGGFAQMWVHPLYDALSGRADLAVLETAQPVGLPPIRLSEAAPLVGQPVTLSGWGLTETGTPSGLRTATNSIAKVSATTFALDTSGGGNACPGDSGGSVQRDAGVLLGVITSGVAGCGAGRTTHARVDVYAPWISAHADAGLRIDAVAPTAGWGRLPEGATIPSLLTLVLEASDDVGVVRLALQVDALPPIEIDLDTQRVELGTTAGAHRLVLTATDGSMNATRVERAVTTVQSSAIARMDGAACLDATDCDGARCEAHRCASTRGCGCSSSGSMLGLFLMLSARRKKAGSYCQRVVG